MNNELYLPLLVIVSMLGIMLNRFLPFLLFPSYKKTPVIIRYLGNVLPPCVFGLLIVYALKDVNLSGYPYGLNEFLALGFLCVIHLKYKKTILSISLSTILYIILVNWIFI